MALNRLASGARWSSDSTSAMLMVTPAAPRARTVVMAATVLLVGFVTTAAATAFSLIAWGGV